MTWVLSHTEGEVTKEAIKEATEVVTEALEVVMPEDMDGKNKVKYFFLHDLHWENKADMKIVQNRFFHHSTVV